MLVLQPNVGLVSDCCVYIERRVSVFEGLPHVSVAKIVLLKILSFKYE